MLMLKDKLNAMKAASAGQVPPETMAIMLQSRDALTNSNILERAIKVGDKIPDFSLADATGNQVSLAGLRHQGPVLISIYRGVW
jgi:hypothetical protein